MSTIECETKLAGQIDSLKDKILAAMAEPATNPEGSCCGVSPQDGNMLSADPDGLPMISAEDAISAVKAQSTLLTDAFGVPQGYLLPL